jgi:hypothetical protein
LNTNLANSFYKEGSIDKALEVLPNDIRLFYREYLRTSAEKQALQISQEQRLLRQAYEGSLNYIDSNEDHINNLNSLNNNTNIK